MTETSFRKPEKKAFFPDKRKIGKPIPKSRNFFNQPSNNKGGLNRKNFARKFAEQQATKRFIHPEEKKFDKKAILRHPILGRINLTLALDFFDFHFKHHQKAINLLKK